MFEGPINPTIGVTGGPLKGQKAKKLITIGIMHGSQQYDLLADLGNLKADISIKQFLGVAPQCRSLLQSTLIRKISKLNVNEVAMNPNPCAPTIDILIDGIVVQGVQVDGGLSVNLMNIDTLSSLQFTRL